jgi:hypothetical protein
MGLAFATRNPTSSEVEILRHMLATFRDGSGNQRDDGLSTHADWRQVERCFAELLGGDGGEDKSIFDVIAQDEKNPSTVYGFSIKSKALSINDFNKLANGGRVYMEIANSPAKFWAEINQLHNLTEESFRRQEKPSEIGNTVLNKVMRWHEDGKNSNDESNGSTKLDLENSCYLCITSSKEAINSRKHQVHAFPLKYPRGINWKYKSSSCLSGYDPDEPDKVLVDWYGVSGGQLKYYPKTSKARFNTPVFTVPEAPKNLSILQKALEYFPHLKK